MTQIGRYRITRVLGQGGMGVVYAAHDDRLDRAVAIKVIKPEALADDVARERFRREARAAARVSHPHICPLYEFDEDHGQPFLVMELLDGEPLSARLQRGPMLSEEALAVADTMLDALAALHRRGVVHRDLKPANIFLTPHGLKLLDFGLAHPLIGDDQTHEMTMTGKNVIVGTPQYMAPEQLLRGRADERADIFAAAIVIYEMLAGRPAFSGETLTSLIHAVGYTEPEPLDGAAEMVRIDGVLRQAMAKDPAERVARAEQLAAMLREAVVAPETSVRPRGQRMRFVALPMRVLRPDPDTDFLAFSVPDAVSVALASLESVVVRSPQALSPDADVRVVGRDLAVDVVLTGTILRAGSQVRVSAHLADAKAGTLIWSDVAQAPIEDLFQLQDTLTNHIVSSLALPLSAGDRRSLDRQAPASAEAYELYLRANQLTTDPARWGDARDLYERAVALDPTYAPAWARLGRARRVLAKYGGAAGISLPMAEAAFRRAFELDPDLSIAHDLAAYVEAELGRAPEAMERLLKRAAHRRTDTGVLAGLVTTCRYAGLLDASRAAHQRAVLVDPAQRTSVAWTYFMLGDYEMAIQADTGSPPFCALMVKILLGRVTLEAVRRDEASFPSPPGSNLGIGAFRALFEGKVHEAMDMLDSHRRRGFDDPEGWYFYAFWLARLGATEPSLMLVTRAVDGGYACHAPMTRQPEWTPLRGDPAFGALLERTAAMVAHARARFDALDGAAILASSTPPSSKG